MSTGAGQARRRAVVLATLVVGSVLLGLTLRLDPGDDGFLAGAGVLAAVWGVGAVLSGPVPLGDRDRMGRAVGVGFVAGLAAVAVFLAGGFVVTEFPVLRDPADQLLAHAAPDTAVVAALTLLNGVAEELFFRGALFDALPTRLAVPASTGIYALTTVGSGVALLVVAAVALGAAAALLRRRTGGVLAPVALHLTWSAGMLLALPSVLATGG